MSNKTLLGLLIVLLSTTFVSATITTHNFDGNVYDSDENPLVGVEVVAWISGTERGSSITEDLGPGYESYYFIDVQGDTSEAGLLVTFTISSFEADESHEFETEGDEDEFHLHLGCCPTTTTVGPTTTTIPGKKKELKHIRLYIEKICVGYPVEIKTLGKNFKPIHDVDIDIYYGGYYGKKKVAYGYTDYDGIFEFIPEKPGEYLINADKSKYETEERTIDVPSCLETCEDGIQNQDETDIDCGGSICDPCEDGKYCIEGSDCISKYCYLEICISACTECSSCYDKLQNQGERDIDCGGPCEPCEDGKHCLVDFDCISNYCYNDTCRAPSCFDGIQNQEESGIDCGGPCSNCITLLSGVTGYIIAFPQAISGNLSPWMLIILLLLITVGFSYQRGVQRGRQEHIDDGVVMSVLNKRAGIG